MSKQERDAEEQLAKEMMRKADEAKKEKDEALKEKFKDINDPKKQLQVFRAKLWKYNEPKSLVVVGFFFACIFGLIQPLCGTFFVQIIFGLYAAEDQESMLDSVSIWIYGLVGIAILAFVAKCLAFGAFSWVAQNIVLGIRRDLYLAILRKEIAWHDDRENASGMMSAMLASDVETLNGASTEAMAAGAEAFFALVWAIGLGFYFSWPMTVVFLCVLPLMMIGAVL